MKRQISFRFKSKIENIYPVENHILNRAQDLGYDVDTRFSLRLAMDEALINAIVHGNQNLEEKEVTVTAEYDRNQISVTVSDEGEGFDRQQLYDPREEPYLQNANGRGVFLIRQFTHNMRFNEKGNAITFTILRSQPLAVLQAS